MLSLNNSKFQNLIEIGDFKSLPIQCIVYNVNRKCSKNKEIWLIAVDFITTFHR